MFTFNFYRTKIDSFEAKKINLIICFFCTANKSQTKNQQFKSDLFIQAEQIQTKTKFKQKY